MHTGREGERLAQEYLTRLGYRILAMNFRFHHGEIDIVAQDGAILVFCEVKARWTGDYGPPEAAITPQKQRQVRKVAEAYLITRGIREQECRFDAVAVDFRTSPPVIRHILNAF
jgi:putative endonuclease